MSGLTLDDLKVDLQGKIEQNTKIANEHNATADRLNQLKEQHTVMNGAIAQLQAQIESIEGEDKEEE